MAMGGRVPFLVGSLFKGSFDHVLFWGSVLFFRGFNGGHSPINKMETSIFEGLFVWNSGRSAVLSATCWNLMNELVSTLSGLST